MSLEAKKNKDFFLPLPTKKAIPSSYVQFRGTYRKFKVMQNDGQKGRKIEKGSL